MLKVLITGGSKGIGLETTKLFLENNYFVYCLGRDFTQVSLNSNNLKNITFDLSNVNKIQSLIDEIGQIDILVNAAGYMTANSYNKYSEKDKANMIKINLEAPVEVIRTVVPNMLKNKWGRIINIASLAGVNGHPDIWYGITKAGLINVTKSMSYLLKETGTTINSIAPGPVNTKMMHSVSEENKEYLRSKLLVTGNYLDPTLIANTILWLASDSAAGINGACIEVNPAIVWK